MRFNLNLEDIKYIKILYKDINENPCTTKAALKKITEREILACARYETELALDTPQDITLSIVCNDGLYRTKTRLKSAENDEPYAFFYMETPQGLEYQQNREYFRVVAEYNCVCILDEYDDDEVQLQGKTVDISANGVSVILSSLANFDERTSLVLVINGKPIKTKVKYVRSESVDEGYRISFMYTKISEADRDVISQACIQNQLAKKRRTAF